MARVHFVTVLGPGTLCNARHGDGESEPDVSGVRDEITCEHCLEILIRFEICDEAGFAARPAR